MQQPTINEELIEACLAGDRRAQRALYDLSLPRLRYLAERYLFDGGERADALQESYLRIFKHLDRFDGERAGFLTWAGRITINVCLRRNARHEDRNDGQIEDLLTDAVAPEPGPLRQLTDAELLIWLRRMPHAYYVVFNLHAVDGYGYAEVARLLGITPELARQRFSRARAWLRKDIARNGAGPLSPGGPVRRDALVIPILLALQSII